MGPLPEAQDPHGHSAIRREIMAAYTKRWKCKAAAEVEKSSQTVYREGDCHRAGDCPHTGQRGGGAEKATRPKPYKCKVLI